MGKRKEIDYLIGTCSNREIALFAQRYGRPSSWKNACRMVKEYSEDLYYDIQMNFNNPWAHETNIKTTKEGKFLHTIYSGIDYIFKLKE